MTLNLTFKTIKDYEINRRTYNMELTNYSIEDLKYLLEAVLDTKRKTANPYKESAMLQFEVDIEQAIKDKEFERDQTTLPPLSN